MLYFYPRSLSGSVSWMERFGIHRKPCSSPIYIVYAGSTSNDDESSRKWKSLDDDDFIPVSPWSWSCMKIVICLKKLATRVIIIGAYDASLCDKNYPTLSTFTLTWFFVDSINRSVPLNFYIFFQNLYKNDFYPIQRRIKEFSTRTFSKNFLFPQVQSPNNGCGRKYAPVQRCLEKPWIK